MCTDDGWNGCSDGGEGCTLPPPGNGCEEFPGTELECGCDQNPIANNWCCYNPDGTPIVIDTQDQGFHLTDWQHGVFFTFFRTSSPSS